MAEPISFQSSRRDPSDELRSKLEVAPAKHAEAVLAAYELLQELHNSGVFDVIRGVLDSKDDIAKIFVEAANKPDSIRIARNLVNLTKILATIEPELLDGFVQALPKALADARVQAEEPPSFWRIMNKFRKKNVRRAMVVVSSVLEMWGRSFAAGSFYEARKK